MTRHFYRSLICYIRGVFSQNGYPEDLFTSCLRRFVNNKCDKSTQNSKIKEDRVETIFFIPYIGLPSIIFSQKLKELFKTYYCIHIGVVFTSFKVKNYFSLKCRTPLPLLTNVVYIFKCLHNANNTYTGKTIQHLKTRVKEHGTSPSAAFNHLSSCETCKSNLHVIIFQVLILVEMIMRSLLRSLCILNVRNQPLIDDCLHRAPHLCQVYFSLLVVILVNWG